MPNGTGQGDPGAVASGAANDARSALKRIEKLEEQVGRLLTVTEEILKLMKERSE